MQRRNFIKAVGVTVGLLGSGIGLAACGRGSASGIPAGEPSLNVINASFETLTGTDRRFAFGVSTFDNVPVKHEDLEVWLRDTDGNVLSGPYPTTFHDEGGPVLGIYVTRLDVPEPGIVEVVAVGADGYGVAAVNVVTPKQSPVPVPGGKAVSVRTPTVADDLGVAQVCTRNPDCGMHEHSIDELLAAGTPFALIMATPAYCQTAVCAPAVDTLDEVRTDRDWSGIAFVHVEIFRDEGQTPTKAVLDWGLQSEPWFFTVDGDGTIVDRLDGPMVKAELTEMVSALT